MSYPIQIHVNEDVADMPWRDATFLAFDFETTDADPLTCGLTQVGMVRFKFGNDGVEIEDEFETLINPKMPIHEKASLVTGITDEMVMYERTFEEMQHEIFARFNGVDCLVGYNIYGFDMPLLQRLCDEIKIDCSFSAPIDPFIWFFRKKRKLKGTRQGDAAKEYGVGVMAQIAHGQGKLHDALTDVRVCANLLYKMSVRDVTAYTVRELLEEQELALKMLEQYRIKNNMT